MFFLVSQVFLFFFGLYLIDLHKNDVSKAKATFAILPFFLFISARLRTCRGKKRIAIENGPRTFKILYIKNVETAILSNVFASK